MDNKTRFLIIFPAAFLLLAAFSVPLFRFLSSPPGHVFNGTQFYSDDYSVYAHSIMQGIRGRASVVDKFTSEPHPGTLFHIQYLLLGKFLGQPISFLTQVFNSPLPPAALTYHLSRFIFGVLALWAAWQLVKEIFPESNGETKTRLLRLSSWFLILFSGIFPKNFWPISWPNLEPYFREPDVTVRFAFQPHFLTGAFALLIIFVLFLRSQKRNGPSLKSLLYLFLISFLTGWTEPSSILIAASTLALFTFTLGIITISTSSHLNFKQIAKKLSSPFLSTTSVVVGLLPSVVYFERIRTQLPWSAIALFDQTQNFTLSPTDFFPVFGIPLVLAPIGLILLFKKVKSPNDYNIPLLLLSWITAFFLLFYFFAPILNINRLRLFHPPLLIAFALRATYAVIKIAEKLKSKLKLSLSSLVIIITTLIILPTLPTSIASLHGQLGELADYTTLIYPTLNTVDAFSYLRNNTPENTVVAALYEAGSTLPFFSGNTSYAGNLSETLNYTQKSSELTSFFSGAMSASEAESFLKDGHISYIFWGPQEKSAGGNLTSYPFLKDIYRNHSVDILQFIPQP